MINTTKQLKKTFQWAAALVLSCTVTLPLVAENDRPFELVDEETAPELTEAAEKAIDRGLKFLLANQNKDGSWSMDNGDYAIAGTSLGLMAFMVEGHFPGFGRGGTQNMEQAYFLGLAVSSATAVGVGFANTRSMPHLGH